MKRMLSVMVVGLVLAFSVAGVAYGERRVVVNGARMTLDQIQVLEQLHCGPIPNGNYWLNLHSGVWGYAGDPRPVGHISDNCYVPERRPSLSERGMLFSPHDWQK
jgi:hypothetical protein